MKRKILASGVCAALGMMCFGVASAETQLSLSGFGTIGATHSDSREADYRGGPYHTNGAGRSSAWMYGVDTKAGVQVSANFGNGLSGVAQVVSDHRGNNSYSPIFEWLNLKYDISKNWYVRGGRVVVPTFMVSDTRNVGYSQTPVRMPLEVYFLNPITHLDGFDIGNKLDLGGGNLTTTLTLGKSKDVLNLNTLEGKSLANLGLTYEIGSSLMRANYLQGKLWLVPNDNLVPGTIAKFKAYYNSVAVLQANPAAGYASPNTLINDLGLKIWALGYTYDPGTWIVQAEYVSRKIDGAAVHDLDGWYVLAGHRFGKFTPYLSVSEVKDKEPAMRPPAVAAAPALALPVMVVNATDASWPKIEQKACAVGVRYDLMRNVDLKAQFEVIKKPSATNGSGTFANPTTAFKTGDQTVKLFTATIDFVF